MVGPTIPRDKLKSKLRRVSFIKMVIVVLNMFFLGYAKTHFVILLKPKPT